MRKIYLGTLDTRLMIATVKLTKEVMLEATAP